MITHITVEDAAKLISRIAGANETQALTYIREAADRGEIQAADALEKLQAELEQLRQAMEACELGALSLPDQIDALMDAGKEVLQEVSTLTPPNEWVSVEDEIPSDDDDGLEFFCMTNATGKGGMSVSDTKKPVFNADAAEEYFSDLLVFYRNTANDIFRKDNEGRHASNQTYSAEYQKYVGMQMAMREVLEYFSKFEL